MKLIRYSMLLLSFAYAACLKEPVDDGPGPGAGKARYVYNWLQIADSSLQGLTSNFWNQEKYFNQNSSGGTTFNYWPNAHALDVLTDAYIRKNDPAIKSRMDDLLAGMKVKNGGTYINYFYDDMEWMTLACLRGFEATGDTRYKDVAVLLWNDIKGGWDDVWGGGIHWNKDKSKNYKNTPANAPACIIACRMYAVTQNPDDIAWAKKIYDWEKSTLVDPASGLVWDGINQDGSGQVTKNWNFTYNQGVFIGAGVELYKLTGQNIYLNDALKTANNTLGGGFTNANILKDEGGGDGGLFKGVLVRYLMLLITDGSVSSTDAAKFAAFLQLNAETLWLKGTTRPQVLFNKDWTTQAASSDLTTQLSGAMLIEAAAKLKDMGLIK
ncbi:glycosyl hydrolase family 76 [Chitinophaga polysaccharea]|uniref:glycoside hydrolase family 76 protein n=1 Tax=Chitinophaga TaxID=79328 RepID=UPI00145593E3|nr:MULTISPECIES: glycoside hydrolase family 76 protein [Chitinophaga]NLR60491.1 glycosyl hydrolase family 76 [Chitinophaga polysaccharea]NLU90407.1 glycosyl hydrolase family 76 [Chitinophaga sp. Ak27]